MPVETVFLILTVNQWLVVVRLREGDELPILLESAPVVRELIHVGALSVAVLTQLKSVLSCRVVSEPVSRLRSSVHLLHRMSKIDSEIQKLEGTHRYPWFRDISAESVV